MRYRKKPVSVEVWQFTKENYSEGAPQHIRQAIRDGVITLYSQHGAATIGGSIETLEGVHQVSENDWIIQGVHGEFYPCKPDIFAETYEPDEPPQPLTLEQLRGMDGKPVYVVTLEEAELSPPFWAIVDTADGRRSRGARLVGVENNDDFGAYELYNETWLAYPTEPGREDAG